MNEPSTRVACNIEWLVIYKSGCDDILRVKLWQIVIASVSFNIAIASVSLTNKNSIFGGQMRLNLGLICANHAKSALSFDVIHDGLPFA